MLFGPENRPLVFRGYSHDRHYESKTERRRESCELNNGLIAACAFWYHNCCYRNYGAERLIGKF